MAIHLIETETGKEVTKSLLLLPRLREMPRYDLKSIELPCHVGSSITDIYREAVKLAKTYGCPVTFEGNGIVFTADAKSDPELAAKYLDYAYCNDLKTLGPREPEQ